MAMHPILRHGLFYALIYIGTGVSMPYVPVWFKSVGLTAPQIGVILSAPMMGRLLAGPLLAIWADGFRMRRTPLVILGAVALAAYGSLLVFKGFWFWMVGWFVAATAISTISPLADVLTLIQSRDQGFQYTLARGFGSLAYIVGNVVGGVVIAATHPFMSVVWSAVAGGVCGLGGLMLLPGTPVHTVRTGAAPVSAWAATLSLFRNRTLMLALATISLIQGSHALYYAFSAIAWTAHGIPAGYVGLLWGTRVGAELAFFWWGGAVRRRAGPVGLVLLGGVGAVIRWTALSMSPPLWLLFPLQCLHALTFTATYVGGLELVERLSPAAQASAAQTLSASLSYGLATGVATMSCGWLYAHFHASAYLVMCGIAVIGVACVLPLKAMTASASRAAARV